MKGGSREETLTFFNYTAGRHSLYRGQNVLPIYQDSWYIERYIISMSSCRVNATFSACGDVQRLDCLTALLSGNYWFGQNNGVVRLKKAFNHRCFSAETRRISYKSIQNVVTTSLVFDDLREEKLVKQIFDIQFVHISIKYICSWNLR